MSQCRCIKYSPMSTTPTQACPAGRKRFCTIVRSPGEHTHAGPYHERKHLVRDYGGGRELGQLSDFISMRFGSKIDVRRVESLRSLRVCDRFAGSWCCFGVPWASAVERRTCRLRLCSGRSVSKVCVVKGMDGKTLGTS